MVHRWAPLPWSDTHAAPSAAFSSYPHVCLPPLAPTTSPKCRPLVYGRSWPRSQRYSEEIQSRFASCFSPAGPHNEEGHPLGVALPYYFMWRRWQGREETARQGRPKAAPSGASPRDLLSKRDTNESHHRRELCDW